MDHTDGGPRWTCWNKKTWGSDRCSRRLGSTGVTVLKSGPSTAIWPSPSFARCRLREAALVDVAKAVASLPALDAISAQLAQPVGDPPPRHRPGGADVTGHRRHQSEYRPGLRRRIPTLMQIVGSEIEWDLDEVIPAVRSALSARRGRADLTSATSWPSGRRRTCTRTDRAGMNGRRSSRTCWRSTTACATFPPPCARGRRPGGGAACGPAMPVFGGRALGRLRRWPLRFASSERSGPAGRPGSTSRKVGWVHGRRRSFWPRSVRGPLPHLPRQHDRQRGPGQRAERPACRGHLVAVGGQRLRPDLRQLHAGRGDAGRRRGSQAHHAARRRRCSVPDR